MSVLKIKRIEELPVFDMPNIYKEDRWDIISWNKYMDSNRSSKSSWRSSSAHTEYKFDFTLVKNEYLREEMKYALYFFYEIKNVCIFTLSVYYRAFQSLAEYLNKTHISSLLDIATADYKHFLMQKEMSITNENGNKQLTKDKCLHFLIIVQKPLDEYYKRDIPEHEKLVWHADKLPCKKNLFTTKNLDFRDIKNKEFQKLAQDFCYNLLTIVSFEMIYIYLKSTKVFFVWLERYPQIKHLNQLDRNLVEEIL